MNADPQDDIARGVTDPRQMAEHVLASGTGYGTWEREMARELLAALDREAEFKRRWESTDRFFAGEETRADEAERALAIGWPALAAQREAAEARADACEAAAVAWRRSSDRHRTRADALEAALREIVETKGWNGWKIAFDALAAHGKGEA